MELSTFVLLVANVTWPSFLSTASYKRPFFDEPIDFNVIFRPRRQILLPRWKHRTKGDRRYLQHIVCRGGYRISEKGGLLINNKTSVGGGGAVRFRPILRAGGGGGGVCPLSADYTSGGGGGGGVLSACVRNARF